MKWILLILTCLVAPLLASSTYGDLQVSTLDDVYDGDTFKVTIDELHPLIGNRILVRIAGIDTPELRSKDQAVQALAYQARDYAASLLYDAEEIMLVNVRRDKYFRILADVYLDGLSMGDLMIQSGFAKFYDGKTKPVW